MKYVNFNELYKKQNNLMTEGQYSSSTTLILWSNGEKLRLVSNLVFYFKLSTYNS